MTVLWVVLGIVLFIFLFGQVRVGAEVEYSQDGITVQIRLGSLRITVYPVERKKTEEPSNRKDKPSSSKGKEKKEEKEKNEKIGGTLVLFKKLLPLVAQAAGEIKCKLRIDLLVIHLTWAAKDPASAAMGFGRANTALGILYPLLDQNFNIKEKDVGIQVSFDQEQPLIYLKAVLTLTIGRVSSFGVRYGIKFLSVWLRERSFNRETRKRR